MQAVMRDRVCLLTGASAGIGREAARQIARTGMTLVLVCRDLSRGEAIRQKIVEETGSRVIDLLSCDLSVQAEVRQLTDTFLAKYSRLDVLINNAGVMKRRREMTADGVETTFAVNHLAPFLLTSLLRERLKESAPSRVVTVSSAGHFLELTSGRKVTIDFDDLNAEKGFDTLRAYSRSKLANVLFTYELARRLAGTGVVANCLHPGSIRTDLGREMPFWQVQAVHLLSGSGTPEQGAKAVVHLALSPETGQVSGAYFGGTRPADSSAASHDLGLAKKLWEVSERVTGLDKMGVSSAE